MKLFVFILTILISVAAWADFTADFNLERANVRSKIGEARTQFPNWESTDGVAYRNFLDTQLATIRSHYLDVYTRYGRVLTSTDQSRLTTSFNTYADAMRTADDTAQTAALAAFVPDRDLQVGSAVTAVVAPVLTAGAANAVVTAEVADADAAEDCGEGMVNGSDGCQCTTAGQIKVNGSCRPASECILPARVNGNTCEPAASAGNANPAASGSQESLADTFSSYDPESCEWATDLPRKVHSTHSGCNRNGTTSICVGYVICNVRSGSGKFVRTATCGADKCGASEAKSCVKDRSAYSRKPEDVPTKYMSDRVRSLILAQ